MTNNTSFESSCALLLESAKKIANLQKLNFFIAKSSYIGKMFVQKMKNDHAISNMQKNLKTLKQPGV